MTNEELKKLADKLSKMKAEGLELLARLESDKRHRIFQQIKEMNRN